MLCVTHSSVTFDFLSTMRQCLNRFSLLFPQLKDSSYCLAFTRHLAPLVKLVAPFVSLHHYFFLRALLLLAGDVEANPGPIQGKEMQYQVSSDV